MAAATVSKLVLLADAAEILAFSTKTARRYVSEGYLRAVRLWRETIRVKFEPIDRFIDARPVGVVEACRVRSVATLRMPSSVVSIRGSSSEVGPTEGAVVPL